MTQSQLEEERQWLRATPSIPPAGIAFIAAVTTVIASFVLLMSPYWAVSLTGAAPTKSLSKAWRPV